MSGPLGRGGPGRGAAVRLHVDWVACDGHGLCADLLPELVDLDDWGYPVLRSKDVPEELVGTARATVAACPALALRLLRPS